MTLMGLKLSENDKSGTAMIKMGTHGTNKHTLVEMCIGAFSCTWISLFFFYCKCGNSDHLYKCPAGWNILFPFHFWRVLIFSFGFLLKLHLS